MALKNKSEISTIDNPEFINLTPSEVSPLISECEIKVFYLGHNRNGSYINKETAEKMSKTLRGTPIVAAWREEKEDFSDHGHVITIEDGEVHFSCKTIPYGFVSPDAKVWFQNFIDTDEFDNQVERTYLMTTGYLWTGQFEEITKVVNEGQPQSMEIDIEDGHWATDNNLGIDFFIINDAVFSKLCILGDDVEPCYEGSSVTSPQVGSDFSVNNKFEHTLFTMMQELKETLENNKGGLSMSKKLENFDNSETLDDTPDQEVVDTPENDVEEEFQEENEEVKDSEDEKDEDKDDSDSETEDFDNTQDDENNTPESEFTAEQFEVLNNELESLRAEVAELRNFKFQIEMQKKQALVNSYFMLSDEDKANIVTNLANYSLEEIEAKLALLYVEKNVDFTKVDGQSEDESSTVLSFSLEEETSDEMLTDLQRALRNARK